MISFEEAEKIANANILSNHSFVQTTEKPYGWYFFSQNDDYLKTKDFRFLEAGSGGFIVEKESGKVVNFGSAFSTEENFKIYEKGLIGRKDLIILKVREINEAVRLLNRLQMKRVEPKFENSVEWKIPKIYKENEIKAAISKLPCVFKNQDFYFRYKEFLKIDESKCFDYELK